MADLFGSFYVTPTMAAINRGWRLCEGSAKEYARLRRNALPLAHFPNCGDWDWIQTLPQHRVGELRIDERIAGKENIRIIFYKANIVLPNEPLPRIWTLTTFAKKTEGFSKKEVQAFRAMKDLVVLRHYDGRE